MQLSKRSLNRLLLIGYYQIIGGVVGIILTALLLSNLVYFNFLLLLIPGVALLLFVFSIYCGILLVKRRVNSIRLSLANQYLQLISFAIGGYAYQYFSGLYLTIGFDLTNSFMAMFGFGVSSWRLTLNTGDPFIQLDFNFVALIVIVMLHRLNKQIKAEQNVFVFEHPESPD